MFSFLHKKILSLWSHIKPKKKIGLISFALLSTFVFSILFLFVKPAAADSSIRDGIIMASSELTLWVAGLFLKLTIFALKFVIELGGYNGYLDSQAVQVGWVMVRDVVNMGFVIILLVIAFGTILGIEQYEWKKMIVKFILAAVFVNFSRTICGLIIDASQVVMTTFVNGVAATAGGNLINAFDATNIMSLSNGVSGDKIGAPSVMIASVAALVFSVMMLTSIVIYLVILLFRMVSLWTLIVLSPIAFVTSIIPQTQKYASEWWKEFGNNVISGPLIIFFLWLAFVTVGSGHVHDQISNPQYNSVPASSLITGGEDTTLSQETNQVGQAAGGNGAQSAGITSVMTWANMANFFIAIAMLFVGAKKAQELGVMGGSMMGKVSEFGKKAFMMASGAGTALWAARKVGEGAKKAGTAVGKAAAGTAWWAVGGQRAVNFGKRQIAGFQAWRSDTGLRAKSQEVEYEELDAKTGKMVKKKRREYVRDKEGNLVLEKIERGALQQFFHKKMIKDLASSKKLKRTEDFAKNREELMMARISALPSYMLQAGDERVDAVDRVERGMLAGEKARSEAKTGQYTTEAQRMVSNNSRYKWVDGKLQKSGDLMRDMVAEHDLMKDRQQSVMNRGREQSKQKMIDRDKAKSATTGRMTIQAVINSADAATKSAQDYVNNLKELDLKKSFKGAGDLLEQAIKKGMEKVKGGASMKDAMKEAYQEAAAANPFVSSLVQSKQLAETVRAKGVKEAEAQSSAFDAVVSLPRREVRTPSTAVANAIEQYSKDMRLDLMERVQAQQVVADSLGTLFSRQIELREKGQDLDEEDKLALAAAAAAINPEAWNDDVYDQLFETIKAGHRPGATKEEQRRGAGMEQLAKMLSGWEVKEGEETTKEGFKEWRTTHPYDRERSAQLQLISATGGDLDVVRVHDRANAAVTQQVSDKKAELNDSRLARENTTRATLITDKYDNFARQVLGEENYEIASDLATKNGTTIESVISPEEANKIAAAINDAVARTVSDQEKDELDAIKFQDYESLVRGLDLSDVTTREGKAITADEYFSKLEQARGFMLPAVRNFTKDAYATKHWESAHNQQNDGKLRILRPQTIYEADKEVTIDMAKMRQTDLAASQIHGHIKMDMESHLPQEVIEEMYRAVFGRINEEHQMNNANLRTVKKDNLYDPDEDARLTNKGYSILGGAKLRKTQGAGEADTKERGRYLIANNLLPRFLGALPAALIELKQTFKNLTRDGMNRGEVKLHIDGFGDTADLKGILKIIKSDEALKKRIGMIDIRRFEQLVDNVEKNGAGIGRNEVVAE